MANRARDKRSGRFVKTTTTRTPKAPQAPGDALKRTRVSRGAPLAPGEATKFTSIMERALRPGRTAAELREANQARVDIEARFGPVSWQS